MHMRHPWLPPSGAVWRGVIWNPQQGVAFSPSLATMRKLTYSLTSLYCCQWAFPNRPQSSSYTSTMTSPTATSNIACLVCRFWSTIVQKSQNPSWLLLYFHWILAWLAAWLYSDGTLAISVLLGKQGQHLWLPSDVVPISLACHPALLSLCCRQWRGAHHHIQGFRCCCPEECLAPCMSHTQFQAPTCASCYICNTSHCRYYYEPAITRKFSPCLPSPMPMM
jgi:hypothetical protein